ncbi:hypothetical protein LEN26_015488 [Aphanomyces euteiches]|nr:hypothetical protein LEN26_015488 [Aphanomyces euteiches]KAH9120630.1 hypothetical protein AeMF1_007296 [Aphanomyces euteiches]KAH9187903.1 hypothetical protein AeNC1_010122 [Aphanomyces euteiches]
MSELTVYSFQAALYKLDDTTHEWTLSDTQADGDAIAQYYVFMDEADTVKFRMVGWVQDTGDVVLNSPLTKDCIWLSVNEYFVQFTSPDDTTMGLSFTDVDQARETSTIVQKILQNLNRGAENNREHGESGDSVVSSSTTLMDDLKQYLTFVRTHGTSSLAYLEAIPPEDIAHVVTDLNTIMEPPCASERSSHSRTVDSFLSDEDRQNFRLQYAATQLANVAEPPKRRSCSVPPAFLSSSSSSSSTDTLRRGSVPLGKTVPFLKRSSSSANSSFSSRTSSRRQSLANFDEVEKATMAAVDCNLQAERDNDPAFLRATFGSYSGVTVGREANISSDSAISRPFQTKQEMHVTFNAELARYEGLPVAWRGLNKQFGLPIDAVPKRKVDGYETKIPAVLQMMKEYLALHGGLETEGVFRLAPDKEECSLVKEAINNGSFAGCNDVHIIANLIKVWFRDLPTSLFNAIPDKSIYKVCELRDLHQALSVLDEGVPESTKGVVLWLLDLMAEVVKHEKRTKMSAKNMGIVLFLSCRHAHALPPVVAIVLSPNLFSIASDNPMVALTMSQKVAEFTTVLLNSRLALHHGYDVKH